MTGSKLTLLVGGISLALLAACGDNGGGTTSGTGTSTGSTGSSTTGASTTTTGGSTTTTSGGSTTGGSTTGSTSSGTSTGTTTGGTTGGCGGAPCTPPKQCDTASGTCVDCLTDVDCPTFTDVCAGGSCVPCDPSALANAPNGILAVDGLTGIDSACCGLPGRPNLPGPGGAGPCLTIATAISNYTSGILDGGKNAVSGKKMTEGDTINVTGPSAAGDWTTDTVYPIWLGAGIILHAPGIYFSGSGPNTNPASQYLDGGFTGLGTVPPATFYVAPMWDTDDAGVRLEGATGSPVVIGVNSTGVVTAGATSANSAVQVECPSCSDGTHQESLTLQNANLAGGAPGTVFPGDSGAYTYGIGVEVGPGAQVNFGPGPVVVGNFQVGGTAVAGGGIGVHCLGVGGIALFGDNAPDAGGTASLLTIQGQAYDVWVDSNCHGELSGNPVLGVAPAAMVCPSPKVDGDGVWVTNGGNMTLVNGHVHCLEGDGIHIDRGTAIVGNTSITHCGCSGIYNIGGALFSRNLGNDTNILAENHTGLWADVSPDTILPVVISFSGPGNGVPSGNQMTCASANEPGRCKGLSPAIDVLSTVESIIPPPPQVSVDNSLWQDLVPALYVCDGGIADLKCSCSPVPSCGAFNDGDPPPDNAAIVVSPNNPAYYITPVGSARAHQACP